MYWRKKKITLALQALFIIFCHFGSTQGHTTCKMIPQSWNIFSPPPTWHEQICFDFPFFRVCMFLFFFFKYIGTVCYQ